MNFNEDALQKTIIAHKIGLRLFQSISDILNLIVLIGPENLKLFDFSSKKNFIGIKKYVDFLKK